MKKIKPLVFICVGLMTIATLYGAIDLAKSNSKDDLKNLYVEKIEAEQQAETKENIEVALKAIEEKEIVTKGEKVIRKKETKKPKNKITKVVEKEVYIKPVDEVIVVKKKKELKWESFSRKAVDRKFKKNKVVVDTVQQVQ
jgi:hypothetical protein